MESSKHHFKKEVFKKNEKEHFFSDTRNNPLENILLVEFLAVN
jgi:hypothetical protein